MCINTCVCAAIAIGDVLLLCDVLMSHAPTLFAMEFLMEKVKFVIASTDDAQ